MKMLSVGILIVDSCAGGRSGVTRYQLGLTTQSTLELDSGDTWPRLGAGSGAAPGPDTGSSSPRAADNRHRTTPFRGRTFTSCISLHNNTLKYIVGLGFNDFCLFR